MKKRHALFWLFWAILVGHRSPAQNAFTNASQSVGSTDDTGDDSYQPGTEVLNSKPGIGVVFDDGGTFEHVGQFYVAANGIWNHNGLNDSATTSTDYFGYAPTGAGAHQPYLGKGIKGASTRNRGTGIGTPTFNHLQLNGTSEFPVEGGMYITRSLSFNVNGPGKANVITTPNATHADSPANAVVFAPTAIIQDANNQNYINGFASVTGVTRPFTLPLGDPASYPSALCPLTINTATAGTVTARYQHAIGQSTTALGVGIGSVSSVGSWAISAPAGTSLTVRLPNLGLASADVATLRVVGWNGRQWIDLSGSSTVGGCAGAGCPLTGTLSAGITDLAIGSTNRSIFKSGEEVESHLSVWPNPVQTRLHAALSDGMAINQLQALDLQGRSVSNPVKGAASLDVSALPSGSYVVEALTAQGRVVRTHFVKQP